MTRRSLWRLVGAVAVLSLVTAACGDDDDDSGAASDETTTAPAASDTTTASTAAEGGGDAGECSNTSQSASKDVLKVALLLPGIRNDNSFSQGGYEGLLQAAAEDGAIECTFIEELIDPVDSLPAIRNFATEGYDLVIGHGIEYVDPIQDLYAEFPDVNFTISGGIISEGAKTSANVEDWLYNLQDMAYPNGVVAGHAMIGETIGVVGGPEFQFVKDGHESFREGVLSVREDVAFLEGFAGDFINVQKAAEVTQSLIDQGADFIYCSGDGICIGAVQTASAAGIPISTGFGTQLDTAPEVLVSATQMVLKDLYLGWFTELREGTFGTSDDADHVVGTDFDGFNPSGIFNGQVAVLPINTGVTVELAKTPAELQAIVDELVASIQDGSFEIPFPTPG
jgi:basic membrane protein A and related proteins